MSRLRRLPPLAVAFAITGAVVLVVSVLLPLAPRRTLEVRVDLSSSAGFSIGLFHDDEEPPQITPLRPGTRSVYSFEVAKGDIEFIRIDLVDALGAEIAYYSVQVVDSDGQVLADYPPFDLATWTFYMADPSLEVDALRATAVGPAPSITGPRTVRAPSSLPWPFRPILDEVSDSAGLLGVALVILGLGAALLGLLGRRGRSTLLIGALASVSAVLALDITLRNPQGLASASSELGRATYLGLSLPTNIHAVWALYGYAIVLALAGALVMWWRSRARSPAPTAPAGGDEVRAGRLGLVVAGIAALAAVAFCVPDLEAAVLEATEGQYPIGWDVENLLVWTEFAARGLTPMEDFWYPYGNTVVFESGLVTGPVLFGLFQLVLLASYWWIFWNAAGRRLLASSLALIALLAVQPFIPGFFRYGVGLAIALAYTCIDPDGSTRLRLAARLVFGGLVTLGLFLDPILVAYGAVGVAALLVVDIARGWRRGFRWWARRLAADFALPLAGLVLAAVVAASRGQLEGMVDLYSTLSGSSIYSAEPTRLMSGIRSALDRAVVSFWIPSVLVAVGLFARLTTPRGVLAHGLASRLLVIGATAGPLILKHAVRSTSDQLLIFPVIGLILVLVWASAQRPAWPAVAALGGLGVAVALAYPGPRHVVESIKDLPSRIAYNVALPFDDGLLDRARAERFSDERFAGFTQELAVASDLLETAGLEDETSLFVLGDAPVLYSLLRQRPPWHVVPYPASPVADQKRVVDFLEEETPGIVVVDHTGQVFEGVPHDVRIPLVFQYVIDNYEFDHVVGPYDILVRRPPSLVTSATYWSGLLGADVDLGSTPNVSSYDEPEPCGSDTDMCGAFLVVEAERAGVAGPVDVPLEFAGHPIVVRFRASGDSTYTLPLARTWPWALSTDVKVAGAPTGGWSARIVRGEQPPGTLY